MERLECRHSWSSCLRVRLLLDGNISDGNVSKVTSMIGMFNNARANQDIADGTSECHQHVSVMFYQARAFNQDLRMGRLAGHQHGRDV
jgi:hypothetical protein